MSERVPSIPQKPKRQSSGRLLKVLAVFGTLMSGGEAMADAGNKPKVESRATRERDLDQEKEQAIEEMAAFFPEAPLDQVRTRLRQTLEKALLMAKTESQKPAIIREMVEQFRRLAMEKGAGEKKTQASPRAETKPSPQSTEVTKSDGDFAIEAARKPMKYKFAPKFADRKGDFTIYLDELRFEAAYLENFLEQDRKKYGSKPNFVHYEQKMRQEIETTRQDFDKNRRILSGEVDGDIEYTRNTTPAMTAEQGAKMIAESKRDLLRSVSHLLSIDEEMDEAMRKLHDARAKKR